MTTSTQKKPSLKTPEASSEIFVLRQKGSAIRCTKRQKDTLKGLGLRHVGDVREVKKTDSSYGMFLKVSHIVEMLSEKPAS